MRPARISFNGKPKASALVGNTVAFGLPLNDFGCGRRLRQDSWTLPLFDLATFQQEFGNTTGTYLKPGDRLEATIRSISTLVTPVVAE